MDEIKKDFPIFKKRDIAYLDNASTTQKPQEVINEIYNYYLETNGNAGRGSHELSMINQAIMESTRKKVANFVGVSDEKNIVFTKGSTEGLNIIAFGYALENLSEGDEIVLAISNHHSNIVPWQEVARIKKLKIRYLYLDKFGNLDIRELPYLFNSKTKIISISSVVNTTGVIQNFREFIEMAHRYDVKVVLDCAQSIAHFKHEFEKWDVDFAVFSGHKMFSAQGVGILYGKMELLKDTRPFIYGGDMVEYVEESGSSYKESPYKFEGGTQNVEAILSLVKAIEYIEKIGYERLQKVEEKLIMYATFAINTLDFVETYYTENVEKVGIIAFNVKGVHSHDTAFILDNKGVAVRSGQHCTAPLLSFMGINSCCRVSLGVYNDEKDIDRLIEGLFEVKKIFER
ncbi:SufS family cysteine desulfurase [Streptobacillus moniliformis]|uniref:SufS family cysteine desulfurase n=1 Tax=Streptobacillus moniliformis TaxID=34105 RepID=UPI0007E45EAB|nr:SufS family cysteine desulfurase [Streptobacillus moniliformis]